jgi:RNA 2',3'-cyclic 3'-phosphodiesterase
VFTAFYPSVAALADLDRAVAPLRRQHGELTWTRAEQWHLTLTFHADLDEDQVRQLERTVARCAAIRGATSARFRSGGAFPSRQRGRILWAGVEPADRSLLDLRRNLVARLRRQGWELDERGYRPHLTLARSRVRQDFGSMVDRLREYEGPRWDVDRIAIVESRPGNDGRLHHERIAEHLLTGRPGVGV